MKKKNKEINYDTNILVRINSQMLEDFKKVCKENNVKSSEIVRGLIDIYVKQNRNKYRVVRMDKHE